MKNYKLEKKYNFAEVRKGRLYRSAQPAPDFLLYLKKNYEIKTIVNLRRKSEIFEKDFARKNDIRLINIPIRAFSRFPRLKDIEIFFDLFENRSNYPILLHCREGKHRTGFMVAAFQITYENKCLKEVLSGIKKKRAKFHWRLFLRLNAEDIKKIPDRKFGKIN